jgi:serine/threonine protein phosphatase PrpC
MRGRFLFGRKKDLPPPVTPIRVSAHSACGLVRVDNQDALFVDRAAQVYCVADGMGGGAEGARASRTVCDEIARAVRAGDSLTACRQAFDSALQAANREIVTYAAAKNYRQMGSTVALLALQADGTRGLIAHVGDSRVYRIRRGLPALLTRDHTVGVEFGAAIDRRRLADLRDRSHPLSHVLTRAIGTQEAVAAEWCEIAVERGDRYVLCSDGVHDVVSSARLAALAAAGDLETAKARVTEEVLKCGAPDNFSFILVEVPL